jgi:hypothetical protein
MADWKKIEIGNTWNYKEVGKGAEIQGLFVSKEEHVGENDSNIYNLEIAGGDVVSVWGSTLLDIRLKNVKVGEEVKIVYLGAEPSEKRKGKTYHNFEVYHRMPEFKEIEGQGEIDVPDQLGEENAK